jgi:hypothetical protein
MIFSTIQHMFMGHDKKNLMVSNFPFIDTHGDTRSSVSFSFAIKRAFVFFFLGGAPTFMIYIHQYNTDISLPDPQFLQSV